MVGRGARIVELDGEPPLTAKVVAGTRGAELVIVSSAATLLEGDELTISITLHEGARLTVRSAAAQLAFPCPGGGRTRLRVEVELGAGSQLVWWPEPLVAASGCHHVTEASAHLAVDASLLWVDELVLGRTAEPFSEIDVESRLTVDQAGTPVLRDGLRTTAFAAHGPGGLGGARYVATVVDVATGLLRPRDDAPVMTLASGARMLRMIERDTRTRSLLQAQLPDVG